MVYMNIILDNIIPFYSSSNFLHQRRRLEKARAFYPKEALLVIITHYFYILFEIPANYVKKNSRLL